MSECIFCKIIKGEITSYKILEDKQTLAFLDINPVNKGHTLVIPKQHFETIIDTPDNILSDIIKTAQKIATALLKDCDGINIMQSNQEAAGQAVPHLHFHIIPRYKNDNLPLWPQHKYKKGEAEKTLEKIKTLL